MIVLNNYYDTVTADTGMLCRCHKLLRFLCPFLSAVAILEKDCRHILR